MGRMVLFSQTLQVTLHRLLCFAMICSASASPVVFYYEPNLSAVSHWIQPWSQHLVLVILLQIVTISDSLPVESVMKITADCSTLSDNTPVITVTSDLNISPVGLCSNSKSSFDFITEDGIHYKLHAKFTNTADTSLCQFYKRNNVNIYTVDVIVPWGEDDSHVYTHKEKKTISCVFDDYGTEETKETDIRKSDLAPEIVMVNTGDKLADGEFQLEIVNILKEPYEGSIAQGARVALRATATNAVGLQVIGCEAKPTNDFNSGYPIITTGCGDGRVIKNNKGFVTSGAVALSPYFQMFQIDFYTTIQFHCNVTACDELCDGNSCALVPSRKKRSTDGKFVTITSQDVTILPDNDN